MTTLFEHGTLANLMAGNLDGTITLQELLKHGSMGLGTLSGTDGEVVILNHEVYQAVASGKVNHLTDMQVTLPFASVHFPADLQPVRLSSVSFAALNDLVHQHQLENVFAAVHLTGTFSDIKWRVAVKQEKPYPNLLEGAQQQAEFERQNVSGTLIGYYMPAIFGYVTASGWHVHFISDDRQLGGHVLGFIAPTLNGDLQVFDTLQQHLPVEDQSFRQGKVNLDTLRGDISQAEGGH